MRTINLCQCGKKMSKYSTSCNKCHKSRMEKLHQEAIQIVETRACPDCHSGLKRNNSLSGWWQCEQFGAEQFRKDPNKSPCPFQIFTQ